MSKRLLSCLLVFSLLVSLPVLPVNAAYTEGHVHSGSPVTGGGCYTVPIPHTHVETCPHTTLSCTKEIVEGPWISNSGSKGPCGMPGCSGDKVTWTAVYRVRKYNTAGTLVFQNDFWCDKIGHCHMDWSDCNGSYNENDYSICPTTVDGYSVGCGMSETYPAMTSTLQYNYNWVKRPYYNNVRVYKIYYNNELRYVYTPG